ncbi:MAG TPA: MFS transporter [Xanthobacteraceae bacterium]|nr:MFS transporter [Xanthobacteraceae bacterium]
MINPKARPCDEAAIRSVRPAFQAVEGWGGGRQEFWILAATILGSSMAFIDESVVNVALPAIEADLKAPVAVIQWLVNAYTLCLASLMLIGGAVGDRLGRRRVFVTGTAIFSIGSLWCGLSPTIAQLIAARALQGVGAALLVPSSLAIIGASIDPAKRGSAIGIWAGFSAIAAAIGPLLGGWIVDHVSWRWIFLVNPVLALPTIWAALAHVPESRDSEAAAGLDWLGALLAIAGLGSLVFGLIASSDLGWRDGMVVGSVAAGLLLLLAFVWVEAHSRAPMMPLDVFASGTFSGVNLLTLLLYAALGGAFFFLPFDLIQVHHYSATLAGAAFLPFTVMMGALSGWSGGLLNRFGARPPLVVGPTIAAVGLALLALPGTDGSYLSTFFLPMAVLGFGMAVSVAPLTTTVLTAVPTHRTGVASGINNAAAAVANLLAVAVLGAVALNAHDREINRHLATQAVSSQVEAALEASRGKFVAEPALARLRVEDRQTADMIVRASLADSVALVMWLAAALALMGALCAAITIPPGVGRARVSGAKPELGTNST